jgi:hypothetical protein
MGMNGLRILGPKEIVPGRTYTDTRHISSDLNSLRFLADQLCLFLEKPHLHTPSQGTITIHKPDREHWTYRIVVVRQEKLMSGDALTFVGFLGQRLEDANPDIAADFDRTLVAELPDYPGLLGYCTMALICGNFCNLVLFSDEEAKAHWSRSKAHAQAVTQLAPDYYSSVSLYNGTLPRGIAKSSAMELTRIKYFDYQDTPWWRAERHFEGAK